MTEAEKKYSDARNDIIKALHSIGKLEPWQREMLAKELWGAETAVTMHNIYNKMMRQYY